MRFVASLFLAVALLATPVSAAGVDPLIQKLQDISVTVDTPKSQGSGSLFTRKDGDQTVTYVWTAGHVIKSLRKVRTLVVDGHSKVIVEFGDPHIVEEFQEAGRYVGQRSTECRVVKYSDPSRGEDLALLEVRQRNFRDVATTIAFAQGNVPAVGAELYHVSSVFGLDNANSFSTGVISQTGRLLDTGVRGVVFDQSTVTAYPGSSGSGLYFKGSGHYVGMLVRSCAPQVHYIVPVRRLRDWAKEAKIEWAIDATIPMPSAEELKALPVEDSFEEEETTPAGKPAQSLNSAYPFLLRIMPERGEYEPPLTGLHLPATLKPFGFPVP